MLSHFGISRIHDNDRYVTKSIKQLPEFSQAEQYGSYLE
ncbi:hypothetical protein COO91_01782 [Nostoc flagelliforme CCNUN1]|uniref:Uncharacterized protein n=1 Tax=Nostoc flagelliforme CCNUN1 TaxID=2038116 RepID=A0A2K8SKC4_9NOSO|nr:hypothetical protein COO91_01782 [Nostoc flagelliforme CCNUN1]